MNEWSQWLNEMTSYESIVSKKMLAARRDAAYKFIKAQQSPRLRINPQREPLRMPFFISPPFSNFHSAYLTEECPKLKYPWNWFMIFSRQFSISITHRSWYRHCPLTRLNWLQWIPLEYSHPSSVIHSSLPHTSLVTNV